MEIGIVGLPNVGKSSLFNALTKASAQASNFPFTTITPNIAVATVPDERLDFLAQTYQSANVVPATIKFVDIAGLVRGASRGEGLGNQFLSHIRGVDALIEVVRCFSDANVTHVHDQFDPAADINTIKTELILADLQQATKSLDRLGERIKQGDKEAFQLKPALEQAITLLGRGQPLRTNPELASALRAFQFLSAKPLLYVANLAEQPEQSLLMPIEDLARSEGAKLIPVRVKTELEIVNLPEEQQREYRRELNLPSGLNAVIRASYELLDLITFFTAGSKETRAWPITRGSRALQAAEKIHTDFARGFIRAQVFQVSVLQDLGSEKAIREQGKLRSEGKNYVVQDGDVIKFLFNI